jgi:hypothetical protein
MVPRERLRSELPRNIPTLNWSVSAPNRAGLAGRF